MIKQATISVLIGEIKFARSPDILHTLGLGSCVALCLYDRVKKIGGMAHIMSPSSRERTNRDINADRFADKAVEHILEKMISLGCSKRNMTAIMVGGAKMFRMVSEDFNIGKKNVESVKSELEKNGIRIVAEDTGKDYGRSVWFDTRDGTVVVSSGGNPTIELRGD